MKTIQVGAKRIRYRDEGRGPVLLLLHGTLINGATWRQVIGPLSQRFRCIAPDLPLGGQELSVSEETDLSPPGIAALLEDFVRALGLSSFTLLGNDTGGAYAQVYAARHPQRVDALILSSCDALDVFPPVHFASMQSAVRIPGYLSAMAALFRIPAFLRSDMALGLLSHRLGGAELKTLYARHFVASAGVRRNFRNVVRGWSSTHTLAAAEALKNFQRPVLLLWGADDERLFPLALAQRLLQVFPDARLQVVPDSLTYVQEDQPAAFVEHVLAFAQTVGLARAEDSAAA
jgi:pimeloyl-ACP methyl ester carboxylesterase